jgi:hypothetical protein
VDQTATQIEGNKRRCREEEELTGYHKLNISEEVVINVLSVKNLHYVPYFHFDD